MKNLNAMMGGNPLYQLGGSSGIKKTERTGDTGMTGDIAFNPTQREDNQMKTVAQVQNYSSNKEMAMQGRTDMRGNMYGYSDTLG